jgi:hypothetical protein
MRMNIMFGLNHVAHDQAHIEAARLIKSVADQLAEPEHALKEGDTFILRDINGNRVGVADVFKD